MGVDDKANSRAGDECDLVQEIALSAKRLCTAFSHASVIGFAVFDKQLRYLSINDALASINGIPAAAHVGNTIREIFGNEVARQIEPRAERLLATGNSSCFEITAILPTRSEAGSWIDHYFPIKGASGRVNRIGLVVVEVTQQRKLAAFVNQLTCDLRRTNTKDGWWLARELHNSVDQYHVALGIVIENLMRLPEKSPELLGTAVDSLDQRILAMRKLVTAVASNLPITPQHRA